MQYEALLSFSSCLAAIVGCIIAYQMYILSGRIHLLNTDRATKNFNIKNIYLNYHINYIYDYFTQIDAQLLVLKNDDSQKTRQNIEGNLQDIFSNFRRNVYGLVEAFSTDAYGIIQNLSDEYLSEITELISNTGYNFQSENMYNDVIDARFLRFKIDFLSALSSI
jgi:hypothetical protein